MRTDISLQVAFLGEDLREASVRLVAIGLHNADFREIGEAHKLVEEAKTFIAEAGRAEEDQGRVLGRAAESLIRAQRLIESAVEFSEGWLHYDLSTVKLTVSRARDSLTRTQGYVEGFSAGFVTGRMKTCA